MKFSVRVIAVLTVSAAAAATLCAHDMWIEPSAFQASPGEIVSLRLLVGQELLGDPLPRSSSLIEKFVAVDATGTTPVVGRDGGNPAGFVRASAPGGVRVVGYRSRPSAVEQTAEKFDRYLKEEGLDAIAAQRARAKSPSNPVHELFARCAKTLILTGAPSGTQTADRVLGFTVELVAEKNPFLLSSTGGELPVRLTYEGRPLAGALVVAISRLEPSKKLSARTNAAGRVKFNLPVGGMWLIKSVHMTPAPQGSGDAEWMSYWASLTFEIPSATSAKAAR